MLCGHHALKLRFIVRVQNSLREDGKIVTIALLAHQSSQFCLDLDLCALCELPILIDDILKQEVADLALYVVVGFHVVKTGLV